MMAPASFSTFRRTTGDIPRSIESSTEVLPENLQPHEVLLKIHAVSLNFRDVGMITGRYPIEVEERGIPCSDCAAEVILKGSAVTDFAVGDHVSPIFDQNNTKWHEKLPPACLGGDVPGVLREYAVFEDRFLVQIPQYLTWEEGSLLACAGVTAWTALDSPMSVPGEASALLQGQFPTSLDYDMFVFDKSLAHKGTGGVSMFALLICLSSHIQPIITSSSDGKLAAIKKQYPMVQGINYRKFPKLADEVRRITNDRGVDYVINNAGPASIPDDLDALCVRDGTVSLVGFLDGFKSGWDPESFIKIFTKRAKVQSRGVGSKADFESLNLFLERNQVSLSPIIDRVFSFEDSRAAFEYLESGEHVGKIVVKIN